MTSNKPLVTIAIPTYNRAASYLRSSLESALRQSYDDIDIIVSDDCSTDETESLVASMSDPRLRYFRHPQNLGATKNYNFCVEQAKGDYFVLLHDDDVLDDDFAKTCMDATQHRADAGLVRTGTRIVDPQGRTLREFNNGASGLSVDGFFRAWFADMTVWYLPSTLFGTKALRKVGGFDARIVTWPEARPIVRLAAGYPRVDIADVKASFREHPDEITTATDMKTWCNDSMEVLDLICEHVQDSALIRSEGHRHFSKVNYGIARRAASWRQQLLGYLLVFRMLGYPPPICYRFFSKNPAFRRALNALGVPDRGIV